MILQQLPLSHLFPLLVLTFSLIFSALVIIPGCGCLSFLVFFLQRSTNILLCISLYHVHYIICIIVYVLCYMYIILYLILYVLYYIELKHRLANSIIVTIGYIYSWEYYIM